MRDDVSAFTTMKYTDTHASTNDRRKSGDIVLPCRTVPSGPCTQKQWYRLNPGRLFCWDVPFCNEGKIKTVKTFMSTPFHNYSTK